MTNIKNTILETLLTATDEEIKAIEENSGNELPVALKMGIMLLQTGVSKRVADKLMEGECN